MVGSCGGYSLVYLVAVKGSLQGANLCIQRGGTVLL